LRLIGRAINSDRVRLVTVVPSVVSSAQLTVADAPTVTWLWAAGVRKLAAGFVAGVQVTTPGP
jgi:hypothetical protein